VPLPVGYHLRLGSGLERSLLVKFMQRTYSEMHPGENYAHLAQTVEQYFSPETPLWWVESATAQSDAILLAAPAKKISQPVGCLWLGNAVDQVNGDRHAHIFLLYVAPEHRRRGIGTALMHHAETWAKQRGDRKIGLQVFQSNQAALSLYENLGFQSQSLWMVKTL
jgi:ribosomal protein S18 acetylase RimI-like enzyme